MESLYYFLKQTYEKSSIKKLGFLDGIYRINNNREVSFDDLFDDNWWCMQLIKTNLDFKSTRMQQNAAYAYRFRHIVSCWLLGVGLMGFVSPSLNEDMIFHRKWQLSSLMHDYGYYCKETFETDDKKWLRSFGDYYLLKDDYEAAFLACLNNYLKNNSLLIPYTYNDIENYYDKEIKRHQAERIKGNDDKEYRDHGIVGACIAFREYVQSVESRIPLIVESDEIMKINKEACLVTAAHNIWGGQVYKENTLLILMALVDTIESTKKFSAYDKNNVLRSLIKWKDVYTNTKINVDDDKIVLDVSELLNFINLNKKSRNFRKLTLKYNDYIKSINGLSDWTELNVINNKDGNITIKWN